MKCRRIPLWYACAKSVFFHYKLYLYQHDFDSTEAAAPAPGATGMIQGPRQRRQPRHHYDIFPDLANPPQNSWIKHITRVILTVSEPLDSLSETPVNLFGLFRRYLCKPTYDPDADTMHNLKSVAASQGELFDSTLPSSNVPTPPSPSSAQNFSPFANYSEFAFAKWWTENHDSQFSDRLGNSTLNLICDPKLEKTELEGLAYAS